MIIFGNITIMNDHDFIITMLYIIFARTDVAQGSKVITHTNCMHVKRLERLYNVSASYKPVDKICKTIRSYIIIIIL